ncbi:MAG: hypothetical protein ACKOAF_09660 [Actinomycetes bacterium]
MTWPWILLIALLVGLFGLYLSMTAGRLDRLHQRIDTSALGLDALLLRRSAVALELATSGLMDPASAIVVAEAAHGARTAGETDDLARASAESALTQALVIALEEAEELALIRETGSGTDLLAELDAACRRVELGRRFHNDAVRACRAVRRQFLVRALRLAGHAPWPQTWEMDDTVPVGLVER